MSSIFVTGLFYNDSQDNDEEETTSLYEQIRGLSWVDFWIIVYSVSMTVPVPFILRYFFRRNKINSEKDINA